MGKGESRFSKRPRTSSFISASGAQSRAPRLSALLPTMTSETGHSMLSEMSKSSRSKILSITAYAQSNDSELDVSATTTKPIRLRCSTIGFAFP